MKIGVVGTFIRDRIFPWQGDETTSFGGIFFTVSCLANIADPATEICPVAHVGADLYGELQAELSSYGNVSLDGLIKLDRDNTQVQLHYTSPQERYEITTEPMPALDFEALETLMDADAILVNLISGRDLRLDALRQFRQRSQALVYLDFHSRALGIDENGRRFYRRPEDWQDWINQADVLQLNEKEARTLADSPFEAGKDDLVSFGKAVLNNHPSICHLTLAEEGSYLFYQTDGVKHCRSVAPFEVNNVVDIIGCGDAFAAGFIVHYLANVNVDQATALATKVAALNCTFMGSSGMKEIQKSLWQT